MATYMGTPRSISATNKVYIALAAVIFAVLLAIAYVTVTRQSTTVTPNEIYLVN